MCRSPRWPQPFSVWKRLRLGKHGILIEFQSVARHPMWWGPETPAEQNIHESYLHPVTRGRPPMIGHVDSTPCKDIGYLPTFFFSWPVRVHNPHPQHGLERATPCDSVYDAMARAFNARALCNVLFGLLRQLIHSWPLTLWAFPQLDIHSAACWLIQTRTSTAIRNWVEMRWTVQCQGYVWYLNSGKGVEFVSTVLVMKRHKSMLLWNLQCRKATLSCITLSISPKFIASVPIDGHC